MPADARTRRSFLSAVAALGGAGALSACGRATPEGAGSGATSGSGSDQVSDLQIPLYWLGRNGPRTYLFREFSPYQPQPGVSPGDVVGNSISMLSRGKPKDPHYQNPWNRADRVGSSLAKDGTLVLDLPRDMFRTDISRAEAHMALQQLVYTATGAAAASKMPNAKASTRVKVLVDGSTGFAFGGHTVSNGMGRDRAAQAPLWIIDPSYGSETDGDVVFKMVATPVSRSVRWNIRQDGKTLKEGRVQLTGQKTNSQEIQFTQHLPEGEYEVKLYADNSEVTDRSLVSSGTDPSLFDLQRFTVRHG